MFPHDVEPVRRVIVEASRRPTALPRTLPLRKRSGKLALHVRPVAVDALVLTSRDDARLLLRCDAGADALHAWLAALAQKVATAYGVGWCATTSHALNAPDVVSEPPPIVYNANGRRRAQPLAAGERATLRLVPAVHVCLSTRAVDASWSAVDARALIPASAGSN
jgi:hypothetical protein